MKSIVTVLCAAVATALCATAQAQDSRVSIKIEPQPMRQALKDLGQQTGLSIVFREGETRWEKIKAPRVSGDLSAREALEKMLENTQLRFQFVNPNTVLISGQEKDNATAREGDAVAAMRLASGEEQAGQPGSTVSDADSARTEEKGEKKDEAVVEVTGSRIRSLLGGATSSPVITFTRKDIERAGVTSMGELSRLIPQAYTQGSYDGAGFGGQHDGQFPTSDGSIAGATRTTRTTFNLRGLGTDNTLILVNGRRMAKTGIINGDDGIDLAGIPVSSIERIEILTDGASAIYGSDAVGGVINIIQRRDYKGTDVSLSYENTFDSDTAVSTMNLAHSFHLGKLSTSIAGTFQDRNAFAATDRYFAASDDWSTLGGSPPFFYFGSGIVAGAGVVQAVSGNLPGRTSPYALIPTGADGLLRSASDYVTVPAEDIQQQTIERAGYVNIISPQRNKGVTLRSTYALTERMELFADARYSASSTDIEGMPVDYRNYIYLPAGQGGNPFGADIFVHKTFWELGNMQGQKDARTTSFSADAGVMGQFGSGWRYDVSLGWSRATLRDTNAWAPVAMSYDIDGDGFPEDDLTSSGLLLLYDSRTQAPNSRSDLLRYLMPDNRSESNGDVGVSVSLDGPLWNLPAGPMQIALGVERRRESADTSKSIPDPPNFNYSFLGVIDRDVSSVYTELAVPLVSAAQGVPLIHRLDLTGAVRYDRYSDMGGDFSPRYGLTWRPVSWLMLRGSESHAFRAPNIQSMYRPTALADALYQYRALSPDYAVFDPVRNEWIDYVGVWIRTGGNLDLQPETSISRNYGIVLDLPFRWSEGLSLSADRVEMNYTNRLGGVGHQELLELFPDRITRCTGNAAIDHPSCATMLVGRISIIDERPFNIAGTELHSMDYQIRYNRETPFGNFDFRVQGTSYDRYQSKTLPTSSPVSTSHNYPNRYTLQSYWTRGPLGLGFSGFYQDLSYTNRARTAVRFGKALEWNSQLAYDFGVAGVAGRWLGAILADSKLSLTINNIFDAEPPHREGRAGYGVTDARMRRYILSFQKTF